jgi:hypothetical protein
MATCPRKRNLHISGLPALAVSCCAFVFIGQPGRAAPKDAKYPPPPLPGGKDYVTDKSDDFLKPPATLQKGVEIAKTPPTIEFMYFPGQTYMGNPWSTWGESLAANGKYYASLGDHKAPGGNAWVYEYDPTKHAFRQLVDLRQVLKLPDGHYTPGKIHSRLDLADDGWLYFSTHRGSTRTTTDQFHYKGDWIMRVRPAEAAPEVVECGPVPKHCIPASTVDTKRLIFYGATTPGDRTDGEGGYFFAYDLKARKLLYSGPNGPTRAMILCRSTGKLYYTPGKEESTLMRFDPEKPGTPTKLELSIGIRAASEETPQGIVYTVSQGGKGGESLLYAFDVKTEKVKAIGPAAVGRQQYITALKTDAKGRYIYYVPGAHGGADADGSPIVQFDVKTGTRKVLAFLEPFYKTKYGCAVKGTYSLALDPSGDKLFITWNASRAGGKAWDSVVLTVVQIPEGERVQ